jgi:hypothetical protein
VYTLAGEPYASAKTGFQQWVAQSIAPDGLTTMVTNYHPLVSFFCMQAAKQHLAQF